MNEEIKKEIEINLQRVKDGKPLTVPLSVLNGEFKERYEKEGHFNILGEHFKGYKKGMKFPCKKCGKKFLRTSPIQKTCGHCDTTLKLTGFIGYKRLKYHHPNDYVKHIRICKRCKRKMLIIAKGFCNSCYSYNYLKHKKNKEDKNENTN